MVSLPDDLPLVERSAVRAVVLDRDGRILLLRTRDATAPEFGDWWELPGGGVDPGETYLEAALRELREETGILAEARDIGPPSWRRTATFRYRRERRLQHELVVRIVLRAATPKIDDAARLDYEKEDHLDHRWWTLAEIAASSARFYPGRLATLLPEFLNGREIFEPFEIWS